MLLVAMAAAPVVLAFLASSAPPPAAAWWGWLWAGAALCPIVAAATWGTLVPRGRGGKAGVLTALGYGVAGMLAALVPSLAPQEECTTCWVSFPPGFVQGVIVVVGVLATLVLMLLCGWAGKVANVVASKREGTAPTPNSGS